MTTLHGACHCGNVAFDLAWPDDAGRIPARACSCTFCRKHGATWTSHPGARLVVYVRDEASVSRYAFGTRTADFHVCARCGVPMVATCSIGGRTFAVVNVNAFEGVDPARLDHAASDVEGESVEQRLARRAARWIPDVREGRHSEGRHSREGGNPE